MEDENGALNSKRRMVGASDDIITPSKRNAKSINPLTRSQALPNSSTKDGSGGDKSNRSIGGGILGLSGIALEFRKSGNGIRSFFQKSSNQGSGNVNKSIQFTQLEKR